MVKKKAALTLLRLYRKHPDVIPAAEWALRIVSIMDDTDLVGREFIELAARSRPCSGCSLVCYDSSNGTSTRPFRPFRSLLSKGCRPTSSGKFYSLSSGFFFLRRSTAGRSA
jgi:hypothetical protein